MPLAPSAPAAQFAAIIDLLCRTVAARIAGGRLAGPLIVLIWSRLRRMATRFAALAARVEAGRVHRVSCHRRPAPRCTAGQLHMADKSPLPPPLCGGRGLGEGGCPANAVVGTARTPSPQPSPASGRGRNSANAIAAPRPGAVRQPPALPQGFAWLVRLVPEAASGASQLQYLLAKPEVAALIAAAPQAGRILRPLCRMLGVRPPAFLALPRPARRAPPARPVTAGRALPAASPPDPPPRHETPVPAPPIPRRACGPPGDAA